MVYLLFEFIYELLVGILWCFTERNFGQNEDAQFKKGIKLIFLAFRRPRDLFHWRSRASSFWPKFLSVSIHTFALLMLFFVRSLQQCIHTSSLILNTQLWYHIVNNIIWCNVRVSTFIIRWTSMFLKVFLRESDSLLSHAHLFHVLLVYLSCSHKHNLKHEQCGYYQTTRSSFDKKSAHFCNSYLACGCSATMLLIEM